MFKGNPYVIEIKYKGKRYFIWKQKEEQRVRPVEEENDESKEVIVKDYRTGGWNTTVNINGETIIVGWGRAKHLTVWGSIILLLVIIIYTVRRHRAKKRDKWLKQNAKRWPNYF